MILMAVIGLLISCAYAIDEPAKKTVAKLSEMTIFHKKEEKVPLSKHLTTSYGTDETKDIEIAFEHMSC